MTKLDNFEFEVSITDVPALDDKDDSRRQIDIFINTEDDAAAVLVLADLVKQLYATNELLNKKGGPRVL